MPRSISTTSRQVWQRIWHHRCRYWVRLHFRYRSPQFYRRWLLVLAGLTLAGVEVGTGQVLDTCTGLAAQSKINRVPCYQWPTFEEIERILADNPAIIRQIETVPPSGATVAIGTATRSYSSLVFDCRGKGFLDISYGGYHEMRAIKAIIGNRKYLLGIPYNMWSY